MIEVTNNELKQGCKTKHPGVSHPMYDQLASLPPPLRLTFVFCFWFLAFGRWHNQLRPGVSKESWMDAEDDLLSRLHETHGNRWTTLAEHLPGR